MISRYFVSINFAAFITFSLFFGMTLLISNDDIKLLPENKRIPIIMGLIIEPPPVQKKIRKPDEVIIEEVVTISTDFPSDGEGNINIVTTGVDLDANPTKGDIDLLPGRNFGGYMPLIKPAPQYPINLAEKGIEGFVLVQFTVTETGSTKDVIILESSHRGFERSALKAVQKFKYMPRFVDGEAVEVLGVPHRIQFYL